VGYKELFACFDGTLTLDKAVDLIKQHTRNYAKRQITWFKNDEDCTTFHPGDIEKIIAFTEIVMEHS
jgi:tRNA dimethylallyltransferase